MSILKKNADPAAPAAPEAPKAPKTPKSAKERSRTSRRGAFSAGMTALAVIAVLVFNLLLAQLPDTATQFDMTNSQIYHISDVSVNYMKDLKEDVVIHVLADKSSVDSRIVRFLSKYEDLSKHLKVEYVNPTIYPSVLTKYKADANSVVVTCEATGRQEVIALDDIVGYDEMSYYYYGTKKETSFDAEGLLTSAVDGVLTNTAHAAYVTQGHDEASLPLNFNAQFKKVHMTTTDINLLTDGGIPDDCDLLIINAPTKDLADDEFKMVEDFLAKGGQVVYNMAGQNLDLPNFQKLCSDYGMTVVPGIIADTQRYYQNNPYLFFPVVDNNVDSASGIYSTSTLLFYTPRGVTVGAPARSTIKVQSFLTTSADGYAVVDESHKTQGTYTIGAVATEQIDDNTTARLTVYGSDSLVNADILNSFTNIDNATLFVTSATVGMGDISSINIQPISLQDPTNTVTTGGLWSVLYIFVIPAAVLIFGLVRWMHRRKL